MLGLRDICEKVADKYGEDVDYIEFVMKDVFFGIKQVARNHLFVSLWKGISLAPWFMIVISPRHLLRNKKFEEYCWYKKEKGKHYETIEGSKYKEFDLDQDKFQYLKRRLRDWLDTTDYTEEEKQFYLNKIKEENG